MPYQPPVREHLFILRDILAIEQYGALPAFAEAPLEVIEQILNEAGRFAGEVLAPLNRVGDQEGCTWRAGGAVTTPPGFKAAYQALVEGGWPALGAEPEFGGQGLPSVVGLAFSEMSSSANMAFSMYPGLTHGAYSAIVNGGSDAQKALYLPKLASGEWAGTMNLTEPQCGTDLGLLRTKAVPAGRRDLQDHRREDLDLRRRAGPDREHRPPGAGPHRGRAGGHARHQPVHRAQIHPGRPTARRASATPSTAPAWKRRWASTATPPASWSTRRRPAGWSARRTGACPDVRDDERGPARRRHAGPGPGRGRLSGGGRLRQGPAAGPLAHRARRTPTARPTRSSSTRTCAAC